MSTEQQFKTRGFLTDYERDTLALEAHEALGELMRHLGLDSGGRAYNVDFDSVLARRMAREYPDRHCGRHGCDNNATYHDFDVFLDGRGYCDEHRPEATDA